MGACFIGIDNGGTETKAAVYSEVGEELAIARVETAALTPYPGFVERDMEEMWQANCTVVREALKKSGVSPEEIKGVAICGHGKGLYLWGKDEKPARKGIISTDSRAYEEVNEWQANGVEKQTFDIACQHVMSCQPVALLAWLKKHEPESYNNIKYVFAAKDYIRFRLTGEARLELTDSSGTNTLNLNTRMYDDKLLELFGIPEVKDALPPLCSGIEVCGHVTEEAASLTGLLPGTPVAGGLWDIDAAMLAAGFIDEERLIMITGTWSVNLYLRPEPVMDKSILMNSLFVIPKYYVIEESSTTSAGNLSWIINNLLPELKEECKANGGNIYDVVNTWVEEIPVEEYGPIYLPFFAGGYSHPNAKACFVGMCNFNNRKQMMRSVYEGVAFAHRFHMNKLMATRITPPKAIRLAGGVTNSPVWCQIFADVMGLPVETVSVKETGTLGCSIASAVASEYYDSVESAVENMTRVDAIYTPDTAKKKIYDKKFNVYENTVKALDGVWDEYQDLVEKKFN